MARSRKAIRSIPTIEKPECLLICLFLVMLSACFRQTPSDDDILAAIINRSKAEQWRELPYGRLITKIALSFVGKPYVADTLESSGPEHLIVNLREFDCVTFIESVLAIAALVHDPSADVDNPEALRQQFQTVLEQLRYRDGIVQGYTSRLHYFSDWLMENEQGGQVDVITEQLGGVPLDLTVDFMSTNSELYPKLQNRERLHKIVRVEKRLSRQPLFFIPEDQIESIAGDIRSGDIVAATTSIDGLDVSHTGIAIRDQGKLKLIHAPKPGENVRISRRTLNERVLEIKDQNGIMVVRPLPFLSRDHRASATLSLQTQSW